MYFVDVRVEQGISNVRATMPQQRPGTVQAREVEREDVLKLHFVDVRVEVLDEQEVLGVEEEVEIEGAIASDRFHFLRFLSSAPTACGAAL